MDLVYDFLENTINLKSSDKIVIGVSSGPDSMFLLYILMELRKKINFEIIVAHINHKVRIESDEEEEFLRNYCLDNNIEFNCISIDKYNNDNFHAYAREFRYNFYDKLIKKYKANYLMTAHHGDDLMETILMRLTRGSTLNGYQGISQVTDNHDYKIIRPLLYMTKDEIKELNIKYNIPYRIDKSNESSKYTRNRYRMNVLPFLKEENKDVHLKFLKFSKLLEENNKFVSNLVNDKFNIIYSNNKININLFIKEDIYIQKLLLESVFKIIYDKLDNIEDKHINLVIDLINKNKNGSSINLPNNYIGVIEYGYFVLIKNKVSKEYKYELKDGLILNNDMKFIKIDTLENGNDTLHLDSSMVKLPLYVRNRHKGDYIEVKGLNGHKKVSDIFIDCKINKFERDTYPIVVDSNDEVIWIPKLKKSKYDSKNNKKCDIIIKCL